MDWNSRQKICSPRRCGQFGTLGSTQRPFVQELEVFSQKVFFLKIPICCVCTLLWGQHLEPLSPTVVYPPVPPFGAASGTLEMQYEGKTSFLSENKHKLHFWSYSDWTSIFMTQFVRLLYYLWLFVISSISGPPPALNYHFWASANHSFWYRYRIRAGRRVEPRSCCVELRTG